MAIAAGRLRHWVDIEEPEDVQDSTGEIVRVWNPFCRVPASIEPLSAREYLAASSTQSKVIARIVIRWIEGLEARMRINYCGKLYNIEGILPDKESGIEYVTIPVSVGVNEG